MCVISLSPLSTGKLCFEESKEVYKPSVCNYSGKKQPATNSPARMDRIREKHMAARRVARGAKLSSLRTWNARGFFWYMLQSRSGEEILIASKQSCAAI